MTNEEIQKIALENGFKLKEQGDGSLDLNFYVYKFAHALLSSDNKWVNISIENPPFPKPFLILIDNGRFFDKKIEIHDGKNWWKKGITHWQALPQLPINKD